MAAQRKMLDSSAIAIQGDSKVSVHLQQNKCISQNELTEENGCLLGCYAV
jgi:hypothetical protein